MQQIREGFNELDTGFAEVDSSDMRQQLLVEISTRTGVELTSVARKGLEGKSGSELLGRPARPTNRGGIPLRWPWTRNWGVRYCW